MPLDQLALSIKKQRRWQAKTIQLLGEFTIWIQQDMFKIETDVFLNRHLQFQPPHPD